MMNNVLKKVFGSRNDRELKRMGKVVKQINALEESLQGLSDEELAAKTGEFRQRLEEGASLDSLLPEAFAVVREAGRRSDACPGYAAPPPARRADDRRYGPV